MYRVHRAGLHNGDDLHELAAQLPLRLAAQVRLLVRPSVRGGPDAGRYEEEGT